MKKIALLSIAAISLILACKKEKVDVQVATFTKNKISGVSQKGPFVNGSSLSIFELDNSFAQTGKVFNTQIVDNLGSFEVNNLSLQTQYAKLKADGYYFNEITNSNSQGPISLYALTDLYYKSSVNINLLSTLEASRAEYLISSGLSFSAAKQQAQADVLKMFFITKPSMPESELLNIAFNNDDNAILLAISVILQGFRTEAELSQLLGNIATDIRVDGVLSSPINGSALINSAKLLDTLQIRSNIENKYNALGITTVIPRFEKYIQQFLDSNTYTFTNYVSFPEYGIYGINLLNTTDSVFLIGTFYSFSANIPSGTTLKVEYDFNGPIQITSSILGWVDISISPVILRSFISGQFGIHDVRMRPNVVGTLDLFMYENFSTTPTRVKRIYLQ